jgi:hypothetical protein
MDARQIRKVPNGYGLKWLACAWHFARTHYKVSFVSSIIASVLLYGLDFMPFLGGILSAIVTPLVSVGLLRFTEKMHKEQDPKLEDIFFAFENRDLVRSLAPIMAIGAAVSLTRFVTPNLSAMLAICIYLFAFAIQSFLVLAVPLVYYRKLDWQAAIKLGYEALVINLVPYLIYAAIGFCILFFSGLLLAIPLVFAVMPATISLLYLQYHSIFEGLDVDALERELEVKKA